MSGLLLKGINKIYPGGNQAVFNFCLEAAVSPRRCV